MIHSHIHVFIEVRDQKLMDVSLELLHEANELKKQYKNKGIDQKVIALLLGYQIQSMIETCYRFGADEVIVVDHEKLMYPTSQHTTAALVQCINQFHPEVLLIGATVVGRDIAPRVAAEVATGLTADVTILEVDPLENSNLLLMTRPAFGGNLYGTIICPDTFPQMASVRPSVFIKKEYHKPVIAPKHVTVNFDQNDWIEVVQRYHKPEQAIDLSKAKIILSAGRGVESCMDIVLETAHLLKATLGASRALVDRGVVSKVNQVGQTGTTVRPSVYLACGISGALQHTAGMDQAQTIIAINTDDQAPIFSVATLGIVADAKEVLLKLKDYI